MTAFRLRRGDASYWRLTIPAGRLGLIRLYMTRNLRLKMTQPRDNGGKSAILALRDRLREERGGRCECCGKRLDYEHERGEMHHILPVSHFPEFQADLRNVELLCARCHKEYHGNPIAWSRQILRKAAELGVDLKAAYGNTPYAANL